MTDEELELTAKVALLVGWIHIHRATDLDPESTRTWYLAGRRADDTREKDLSGGWFEDEIPNYAKDLNAMHQAEKILTHAQKADYVYEIGKVKGATIFQYDSVCAPARQRAEAFIATLAK